MPADQAPVRQSIRKLQEASPASMATSRVRVRAWAMFDNPPMTVQQLYGDWTRRDGLTFKTLGDAIYLRNHVIKLFEWADVVLVMLSGKIPRLKGHVADARRILVVRRTLRERDVYRIFAIPPGTRVLVVNEQALYAESIGRHLTSWGAELVTASSAASRSKRSPASRASARAAGRRSIFRAPSTY